MNRKQIRIMKGGRFAMAITASVVAAQALVLSSPAVAADATPPHITNVTDTPEPFTPNGDGIKDRVTFKWTLSERALVTLKIFNSKGHLVRDLMRKTLVPGIWTVSWNGKDNFEHPLAAGTYNYRIRGVDAAGNARMAKGTTTIKR
jgi:gliding motility-associated-like protein